MGFGVLYCCECRQTPEQLLLYCCAERRCYWLSCVCFCGDADLQLCVESEALDCRSCRCTERHNHARTGRPSLGCHHERPANRFNLLLHLRKEVFIQDNRDPEVNLSTKSLLCRLLSSVRRRQMPRLSRRLRIRLGRP